MEEKKNNVEIDGKTKRRKAKIAVISLCTILVLFLGLQVYASVNGYGNVFFMIKDLVTTKNASGEEEIFIEGKEEENDVNTVKQDDDSKDKVKQLDINSSQVSKLYNYIPAQDINLPELANAYQNSKITMEDMDEKYLLSYAFTQLSLSDANKLPYQNEDGTTEEANDGWFGFKAEVLQNKVKEIYGKNIENQDFDYGAESCRYTNGMYFHSAGGALSEMIFNVRTIDKAYEDDQKIYIEDKYLTLKENTEENTYKLYTSSNCTKLVETIEDSLAEKLGYEVSKEMLKEISKKYESEMVRYKHTFKKNTDGTYYWYSTEPIETENDDTESSSFSQYNAPQLKTNVKDIE